MDTAQIRCFMAAAESHSFTAAAQKLFVSQATLSRQVAALENELEFPLFERRSNIIALTPAGKIMLETFQEMEKRFAAAKAKGYSVSRGIIGTLNLGILDGQSPSPRVRDAIVRFFETYPEIKVNLSSHSYDGLAEGLRNGSLDAVVTIGFDVKYQSWLEVRVIEELQTFLIVPCDHPLAKKKNPHLADFRNERFVVAKHTASDPTHVDTGKVFKKHIFDPHIVEAPDIRTQVLWLETGVGVTCANKYHALYNSPNLVALDLPELSVGHLVIAWPKGTDNPVLERFLELLA